MGIDGLLRPYGGAIFELDLKSKTYKIWMRCFDYGYFQARFPDARRAGWRLWRCVRNNAVTWPGADEERPGGTDTGSCG
jgi:hypothetical protein